jgi:hypothetical protein
MSGNPLAAGVVNTAPLIKNRYVNELLDLLDRCDRDASGLIAPEQTKTKGMAV